MEDNKAMRSKCCGVRIRRSSIGLIKVKGSYERRGVCPSCYRFCEIQHSSSKIFHAALQLLKNIKKGMIIVIHIVILILCFLFVLMLTHVIRIEHKITLYPLLRSYIRTHDLSEMR